MERHFHEELKELKQKLLKMGFLVEAAIEKAVDALLNRNSQFAKQVIEEEKIINQLEIEIDDKGHSLSALRQPMAVDLRILTAVLKMNTDLERMGDHAVNIAERTLTLLKEPPLEKDLRLEEMSKAALRMVTDALNSFIREDVELARSVLQCDDEVDAFNDDLYFRISLLMEKSPAFIRSGINLIMIGHNLERIADLANNIAEDVVYIKQGKEVRHHIETKSF
ncbi:MAG: phosphate transport system regulatory protein PhoU [Omnitrophica bacterium RIFCSPHIGHO2_02_FULL_46_11]|nr:MAG: phosphate transport system regulatory protein PhoU [Omnitrophica bacterium RIFCSPHIGHO2_02_FULL_46_11]OGW87755.1 MAG: phosphate transport system regulatory protein PhoU [Omnitrophica bacterium RIFCSPLOWO2_01_FULL_45_10b]